MSKFDVTVIYSFHGAAQMTEHSGSPSPDSAQEQKHDSLSSAPAQERFPEQTIPQERIEVLTVSETDAYHPHRAALGRIMEAQGEYTILLDAEDTFDKDFLARMLERARQSQGAFVMPGLSFALFNRRPSLFALKEPEDHTIDAAKYPPIYPVSLHGLLIPTQALQSACQEVAFLLEPGKQILLSLLQNRPSFEYLGTCILQYKMPREFNHQYDMRCHTREWYYEPLEQFLLPYLERKAASPIDFFTQHLALYMLRVRLHVNRDNRNRHVLEPEEIGDYLRLLSRILQYIDTEVILASKLSSNFDNPSIRLALLRLKKQDNHYYPEVHCGNTVSLVSDGVTFCPLSIIQARINLIEYYDGKLEIDGAHMDLFSEKDGQVFADFDGRKFSPVYNRSFSLTKFFGVSFYRLRTFHVSIPVEPSSKERLLNFVFCAGGREYRMEFGFPMSTSRFARDFTYGYWKFGEYLSYWNSQGIHVVKSRPLLVLKKELGLWAQMWKRKDGVFRGQLPLKMLNFALRPYFKRQNIWLFLDKIYKGGDSSEYLYRYAASKKDGVKKYYLLDRSCPDFDRLQKEGLRPLARGSLKHRLVFLNADMVIASNSTVFAFNDYGFTRSLPIRGDTHFGVACVQHGMSVQKIAKAQRRLRDNTKLYFCASKYEIENLSKPVYDYEGYDALKLTGVPRYDGLHSRPQKIIVISPTWRMNSAIPVEKNEGVSRDYNPHFKETNYYRVYNGLINDPKLLDAARTHGYRIQYVLHPIVSPQHDDFTKNDVVEIIPSIGNMSYEKIFCEGSLMVTDYSGVQFDFAYMRKPVVYLHHHDIPQHYEEGTFHYTTMGFGEICHTNDELIEVLCRYMEHDCQMPDLYRRRADDFFAFSDDKNCERIYPVLLEYEKKHFM